MFMRTAALLLLASLLYAQKTESGLSEGIAWHGTWASGLAAAKESGKPIFLLAAAPQCHGVSGIW